jgi:NitT/TauT family transport system substrate-binding protein
MKVRPITVFVAAAVLLAALGGHAAAQGASEPTRVTFRLNWKYTGPHAAYFLGNELGYYAEEGIDLVLNEGNGSGNTALLVANRSDMFGLADAAAVMPAVIEGLPIMAVAMASPRTSLAVVARADSGIETLQDLHGKQLAVTAGDSLTQIWPAVVAVNGLDADAIRLVYVDAAAKVPVVLENRAAALLGSSADQNFILEAQGVPAITLDFADHGVNVLNLAIYVHEDMIGRDDDLIERFVRATRRSFEALPDNIELAAELVAAATPEIDPTVALNQTRAYANQLRSPNCPDAPLLYNCPEDWEQTLAIMKEFQGLETDADASEFYTNEFVD